MVRVTVLPVLLQGFHVEDLMETGELQVLRHCVALPATLADETLGLVTAGPPCGQTGSANSLVSQRLTAILFTPSFMARFV
jgi:hypothetical protein